MVKKIFCVDQTKEDFIGFTDVPSFQVVTVERFTKLTTIDPSTQKLIIYQ